VPTLTPPPDARERRPIWSRRRHAITTEITRTERATERYFEAFEQGRLSPERCEQRITRLNARLEDLRAQQAELADDNADESAHAPTAAHLAANACQLETVIADGEPEQAKALLRLLLIAELRVNGRHDIQPTYRVITPDHAATAGVCTTSGKVETAGTELASDARAAPRYGACPISVLTTASYTPAP
jgi:exonuclease VII small subunit